MIVNASRQLARGIDYYCIKISPDLGRDLAFRLVPRGGGHEAI